MKQERLYDLVQKYFTDACSKDELKELLSYIKKDNEDRLLYREMKQYWEESPTDDLDKDKWNKLFYAMLEEAKTESGLLLKQESPKRKGRRYMAIAAVMIFIVTAGYFWYSHPFQQQESETIKDVISEQLPSNDIPPGGNKAVLTLANGKKIILGSAANGSLAKQGNTKIVKVNSGLLSYTRESSIVNRELAYNTITTPRGGQYQVVLADGSKVWMNAASSLRFPTAFNGKERKVTLKGEAYFEIAADAGKPFKVKINQAEVEVLGTRFDIMAYDNEENVKTTLLSGAIKVSNEKEAVMLKPGEQALMNKSHTGIEVNRTNTGEAIAWKNGFFQFNNTDLRMIMRQIARWYDVSVVIPDNMSVRRFTGKMSRNVSLKHVLKVLELSNVHFKLKGKEIILIPD